MDIFAETVRPNDRLFFKSHDSNDQRLGDSVQRNPSEYEDSEVVVLGYPFDEGVKRNNGRVGARKAPTQIRQAFYKLTATAEFSALKIFDLGDTRICPTLEEMHDLHSQIVYQVLNDGKRLMVIGGGNDLSYPDCAGLSKAHKNLLAFNIDSHFDVREAELPNSGTPYRQLLEQEIIQADRFYEMANKPFCNSPVYERYLNETGVHIFRLEAMRERGINQLFKKILAEDNSEAIFWGLDIDSVRTADAPGVSATYPIGLTADEICRIARIAGADERSKILELSEVNPEYDRDGQTARLAAIIIFNFMYELGKQYC
ncbi:arginase [Candidatus Saccharibacteria bacterium]|nr:formimidoylglutamase [Candidatus Saccharibacteria bacterium]NIV71483.1 arginase [Calditrichia bacterium]NIV98037.1 arginase [Candidatus Saccharibacteria bacterium]NIW78335.1 arginase [Calditrichia bacterium]